MHCLPPYLVTTKTPMLSNVAAIRSTRKHDFRVGFIMIFIPENICLDNFKTQKLFPKFPAVDFQGYEPNW